MARKPAAPSGLSARAKRVWTRTLENYELREDELSLLSDYCMELTISDQLQAALIDAPRLKPFREAVELASTHIAGEESGQGNPLQ